ncbi:outer membrane protein [Azospirillum sp.]|uniref:outer membrane protein n=1 Tax=Azospirillum sp. TaxID=34012 RepID=UPI002D301BA7|nr:outer membrane beta-barrel protein [Azospirillum sp.]HYD68800.1 outer membrane beta-barrel protein [Azospirillum sp.]
MKRVLVGVAAGMATGLLAAGGTGAAEQGWYLRADLSHDWSRPGDFHDWDCGGTDPTRVPLYGCATHGSGDFKGSVGFGAGVGYRVAPMLRFDATVTYRPGWRFEGESGFLLAGDEPLRAKARTLTGMINGYIDLGRWSVFEPYVGGGFGLSYNRVEGMELSFPTLDQRVWTPSGWHTSLAWQLTAGTGIVLGDGLVLDVAYRFMDLGRMQTHAGEAPRLRRGAWRILNIDGTEARLRAHGVQVGLRYAF